jgi:hypothetical protein
LIREAGLPAGLSKRVMSRLGGVAALSVLLAILSFVIARSLSRRSGLVGNVGSVAYGVWFLLGVNAYFHAWRFMQVVWNLRFRKPVQCSVQLVSQKDSGLDRRTTVFLPELNQKASFGRTSFAWTPTPFLVRQTVYVFPGRYAALIADGSPPVASTLRM